VSAATAIASETLCPASARQLRSRYGQKLSETSGIRSMRIFQLQAQLLDQQHRLQREVEVRQCGRVLRHFVGETFRLTGGALIGKRKLDGAGPHRRVINITARTTAARRESHVGRALPNGFSLSRARLGHKQVSSGPAFFFDLGTQSAGQVKLTASLLGRCSGAEQYRRGKSALHRTRPTSFASFRW